MIELMLVFLGWVFFIIFWAIYYTRTKPFYINVYCAPDKVRCPKGCKFVNDKKEEFITTKECTRIAGEVCDFEEKYLNIKHTCKYYDARTFPGDACFCEKARIEAKESIRSALFGGKNESN